jgi:hypothetical protein
MASCTERPSKIRRAASPATPAPYDHVLTRLSAIADPQERAEEIALTLHELYELDVGYHHDKDVAELSRAELYTFDCFHFLKCCIHRKVVDETIIALMAAFLQENMDEDYTPHIEYLRASFAFFTYTYTD